MATRPGTIVTYPGDLKWEAVGSLDENGKGIFVCWFYGNPGHSGPASLLMKYSADVKVAPHMHSSDYYAVVVSGKFRHFLRSENEYRVLTTGATWFQRGRVVHQDSCVGPEDGILSLFWPRGFDVEFAGSATPPAS
jgi:hypothetical protein